MTEWSNLFEGRPLSSRGIEAARRELARAKRYWRRKAARTGTRGRRGALSSHQIERMAQQAVNVVVEWREAAPVERVYVWPKDWTGVV